MASNPNDLVFSNVADFVGERITEQLDVAVNVFTRDLKGFLNHYVDQFFTSLVYHNVGVDDGPTYGPMAPKWEPLQEAYLDRKIVEGSALGFYERKGGLKAFLLGQSARSVFGSPIVHHSIGGRMNKNVFIDRAGRAQWRSGSGRHGFASYADAFSDIAVTLEVDLFPKAQGKKPGALLDGGWEAQKLAILEHGRGGKNRLPGRPMMKPFMDWYTTENLRESLYQKFNVRI